jgi:excisionase family DNA binding protein
MKDEDQMLNPKEVADILGVHQKTVHLWLRAGKLTGVKISYRAWRIPRSALKEFIEKNRNISHKQNNEHLETSLNEASTNPITTTPPHLKMKHYIRDIMGEKHQDEQ